MTANAIAISRGLAQAGIEKKAADAIAKAVVTHSDESHATEADIARLEGKIEAMTAEMRVQIKLLIILVAGLYIGLAALFIDRVVG